MSETTSSMPPRPAELPQTAGQGDYFFLCELQGQEVRFDVPDGSKTHPMTPVCDEVARAQVDENVDATIFSCPLPDGREVKAKSNIGINIGSIEAICDAVAPTDTKEAELSPHNMFGAIALVIGALVVVAAIKDRLPGMPRPSK